MLDPSNRRKATRIPVSVPAEVFLKRPGSNPVRAEIIDISIGGAFIHCTAPIDIGMEVFVQIFFEKTQILVAKVTEVPILSELSHVPVPSPEKSIIRWVRGSSKSGFGVEFLDLREDKKQFLVRLVQYFDQLVKKTRKTKKAKAKKAKTRTKAKAAPKKKRTSTQKKKPAKKKK